MYGGHLTIEEAGATYDIELPLGMLAGLCIRSNLMSRLFRLRTEQLLILNCNVIWVLRSRELLIVGRDDGGDWHILSRQDPIKALNLAPVSGESVVYGEYIQNASRDDVRVFIRRASGDRDVLFSFIAGHIRHVHGVLRLDRNAGWLVYTGDSDSESGLYHFDRDFKQLTELLVGGQENRYGQVVAVKQSIVAFTDSPCGRNFVRLLSLNGMKIESTRTYDFSLQGPVIDAVVVDDRFVVFSTMCEGPVSRRLNKCDLHVFDIETETHSYLFGVRRDLPSIAGFRPYLMHPRLRLSYDDQTDELTVMVTACKKLDRHALVLEGAKVRLKEIVDGINEKNLRFSRPIPL